MTVTEWVLSRESLAPFVEGARAEIIGVKRGFFLVKKIDRSACERLIRENHYSKTTVQPMQVKLHLGVFYENVLSGALQLGFAMNPQSCDGIVAGTLVDEYLELNRLWLSDVMPKNSESVVLGLVFRLVKKMMPRVKWVQSFADGRVGVGTIYQATNFVYCGSHEQDFVFFDGRWQHCGKFCDSRRSFSRMFGNLVGGLERKTFPQYRYVYFLDPTWRDKLLLPVLPYPKRTEMVKNKDNNPEK